MENNTSGRQPHSVLLVNDLRTALHTVLKSTLDTACKLARDPEFRSTPNRGEDLYQRYDALDALYADGASIITDYLIEIDANFEKLGTQHQSGGAEVDDLTLVGTDDMEVGIAIRRMIRKAEQVHEDALQQIELRLEELRLLVDGPLYAFCLHPHSLYTPFQHCVDALPLTGRAKITLCSVFNDLIASRLVGFYQQANRILIDGDILATDKHIAQALRARNHWGSQAPGNQSQANPIDSLSTGEFFSPVDRHAWAGGRSQPGPVNGTGAPASGNSYPPGMQPTGPIQHRADTNQDTSSTYPPAFGDDNGMLSSHAAQTGGALDTLADEQALDIILQPYAPGSSSASTPYQRNQVVTALSGVQRAEAANDATLNAEQIKSAVKRSLYEYGSTDANEIVENESKVIDFVSQIFQAILDDEALTDAIKALLAKLQVPVLKLALIDFAFFKNPRHPARILLNKLTGLGIGIVDKEDVLYKRLKSIVYMVIDEFDTDISTFERSLGQIRKVDLFDTEQAKEVEALSQREAEMKARRSAAKRTVIDRLNRHLRGRTLPDEMLDLALKCWAPHMGLIYLRWTTQSENWRASVHTLRQIIEIAQPGRSLAEIERITGGADAFLADLKASLVETSDLLATQRSVIASAEQWYADLLRALTDEANAASPAGEIATHDARGPRRSNNIGEVVKLFPTAGEEETDASERKIQTLMEGIPPAVTPGSWFEIYRGLDRAKRRLKLSTILKDTGQLLFADRAGNGVLEMDIEEFLADLRADRTTLIDDQNRFDRALSSVINTIRDNQDRYAIA